MTHRQLCLRLSAQTGIPINDVRLILHAFVVVMEHAAEEREPVEIDNIGRMEWRYRGKKRIADNMCNVGTELYKPAHYYGFFKIAENVQAKASARPAGAPPKAKRTTRRAAQDVPADTRPIFAR